MAQAYGNATALTVKNALPTGLNIASMQSPDGTNGNKFLNDGRTVLRVKNTNGATRTVTLETPVTVGGLAVADQAVVVPADTGDVLIFPNGPEYNQPNTNDVFVSYSAVTGLSVDVYRLPF